MLPMKKICIFHTINTMILRNFTDDIRKLFGRYSYNKWFYAVCALEKNGVSMENTNTFQRLYDFLANC
jgi:hypothetical protein